MSISNSKYQFFIGYVILAFMFLVLPFCTNHDVLIEDIIVWGLFTMGFNLAFGFTGMVSLGHGVYFGVSAYTIGILSLFWSRSAITIPIGIGVGTLSGLLPSSFRLHPWHRCRRCRKS